MRTNSSTTVRVLLGTAAAALAVLVASGCSSGTGTGTTNTGANGGNAASSAAPAASKPMDDASGSAAVAPMGGDPVTVTIDETKVNGMDHYVFSQTKVKVTDDQLTVTNKTDEDQNLSCTGPVKLTLAVASDATGKLKFTKDGTYSCTTNKGAKISIAVD